MLRTVFLSLFLFVSLSSTSLLRKSISRRQSEPEYCQAIEGFDCKCSPYRVTCTSDRVLPQQINVLQKERQKYPSVELIVNGEHKQNVYDYTFEPVKQLYKPDADNLEFRIKFEKFTALHLTSPGVFNKVFPDNSPANVRKHIGLEIYNPTVQPEDNVNLFANLNVDSLELYVLYPFRGTFQQLFNGANIKYLRLSGGDITSDLSQPFTGNIGRLELAKQAPQINVQTFPIYPAHELIINAFYVTDFNSDNPPNYSNLGELRVYSQQSIPANAFRNYPNLHTLSISTEKDIDPHALDGLYKLEKLTIKDTKPSIEFLNKLPNIKEFEVSLEKLSDREQCELVEKLASGQVAVQAIPNQRECTCASSYLDTVSGRYPCDARGCEQSSCAAIKNNYDATTRTFKTPPAIKRADGSDALRQREPKVYTSSYHISNQDRQKAQQGGSQQPSGQTSGPTEQGQLAPDQQHHYHPDNQSPWKFGKESERYSSSDVQNESQKKDSTNTDEGENERTEVDWDYADDYKSGIGNENDDPNVPQEEGGEGPPSEGGETQQEGEATENQQEGEGGQQSDPNQTTEASIAEGSDVPGPPSKKGLAWLPIIIIVASIAGLLLIGLIILLIRRRRAARGYNPAASSEPTPARA